MAEFKELKGKVLSYIEVSRKNDEIIFICDDGSKYKMYHRQDCCESVEITDVNGDILDLLNSEVTIDEERVNDDNYRDDCESETWTFYTIATKKGYVDIRWHGESNGYYSESVDFAKADKDGVFRRY